MDNYHITKDGNKWKLTKQGKERAALTANTKQEIIKKTRVYMQDRNGSVKIHKQDGKIQEERTYPRAYDPSASAG